LVDLATPISGDEGFIHFHAGLTFAVPAFSEGDGRGLGGHKAEPQQRMGLSQIYSSEVNSGISQPSVHAGFTVIPSAARNLFSRSTQMLRYAQHDSFPLFSRFLTGGVIASGLQRAITPLPLL
jgi:hypothetical protein